MASMELEELEAQPPEKKPCIDNCQEDAPKPNESELPKSGEGNEGSTNLPLSRPHRKLPAELNQQIFLCFNPATQRKFICGLGWDFYAMFRHKLLTKTKRLCNPLGENFWNGATTEATISRDGLNARNRTNAWANIYGMKGFPISGEHFRGDNFPGTLCYYFEVKQLWKEDQDDWWGGVGLSDGTISEDLIGEFTNSYSISIYYTVDECLLDGKMHRFEFPEGAIRPKTKGDGNVVGCGLLVDPNDKLAIFFTLNGTIFGAQIPISPSVDVLYLYPAVALWHAPIEANFGGNPDKPFAYDIKNCPGMELDCI